MKWIIEEEVFDENYIDAMEEALGDLGLSRDRDYQLVKYIPFAEPHGYLPIQPDNDVIVYGSINLLKQVQRYTQWKPGAGVTWDNYKCSNYYKHFGSLMLNHGGQWVTLTDLPRLMDRIGGPMFIRPDTGDKTWVGGVYDPYEARRHAEYVASRHGNDILMCVSEPCHIEWEGRFFCIGDKIITGSQYRAAGKRIIKKAVINYIPGIFVRSVLDSVKWRPDPVFAVDVCISGGVYKIMEISAYHCAGLYECDIKKLTTEVHNYYAGRHRK